MTHGSEGDIGSADDGHAVPGGLPDAPERGTLELGRPEVTADTLWKTLGLVQGAIQFADAKAATILLVDGTFAALISARLVDAHSLMRHNAPFIAALSVGALLWLLSAYYAVACLRPRFGASRDRSLIYFGHIARDYPDDWRRYLDAVETRLSSEEEVARQFAQEVWANSQVATQKHANARLSLDFLILTLVLTVVVAAIVVGGAMV